MATGTLSVGIDEGQIRHALEQSKPHSAAQVREILAKARELQGLDQHQVAALMQVGDPALLHELYDTARWVKNEIYGPRLVLFAPLYISNLCTNDCAYCAFRRTNTQIERRFLTTPEIVQETTTLIDQGHKRILLVAGEAYPRQGFSYVLEAIRTIYGVSTACGEIRRINVNIAPLNLAEFKQLKAAEIGTYQLFQETYHAETYQRVHLAGPKRDYDWRISAPDRAMQAGIDDVGIGVLFGLYDWRFEVLALLQHVAHLERCFGVGPHTISVPRLEPAAGSALSMHPPYPVSDADFRTLIAILRLSVPYTGIILSTRETPSVRRVALALGVSQISAASRTNPGGYSDERSQPDGTTGQFSLGDHRPLDEVIRDACELGFVPSFCTACYRLGRTGRDFMDLAKPGDIKLHCQVNALSTLQEYLLDYASPATRAVGEATISGALTQMEPLQRKRAELLLGKVRAGKRDVFS